MKIKQQWQKNQHRRTGKKCHVGQLIGFFPQDKLFWTHFYPMISMICVIISINLFECKTMQSIVVHTTFEYVWISHARPMSIPRFHGRGSKPIFSVDFGLRWFVSIPAGLVDSQSVLRQHIVHEESFGDYCFLNGFMITIFGTKHVVHGFESLRCRKSAVARRICMGCFD